MDEVRQWENPNIIAVNYDVYFYDIKDKRRKLYIFDLKSFHNQIPKSLHTILMPLSHNSDDYESHIMDDIEKVGVFLCENELIDDGDYDIDDDYCSDYKEFKKWIRVHYDPVSGKSFEYYHHITMNLTDLYNKWISEYQNMLQLKKRTWKQQKEFERLEKNLDCLRYDWYTDEEGIRNPTQLLMNKCLLTKNERKLLLYEQNIM